MIKKYTVPSGYILKEIRLSLVIVAIVTIFAATFLNILSKEYLANILISIVIAFGVAISVLLSFKISLSYGRCWEERQIWNTVVNNCRTLVLKLEVYIQEKRLYRKNRTYIQMAWCYCDFPYLKDDIYKYYSINC